MGSVRAARRALGIHHSTFYRWRAQVQRFGLDILHTRERRRPRMPNATSPFVEQRVLGYALAHPTQGAGAHLGRAQAPQVGIKISPNGIHKILRRHGLNTRAKRLGLVAGYAAPREPLERQPQTPPGRHIEVDHPGELVQMDCFHIGRRSGTKGRCGNTRPSMWRGATCRPSCTSLPRTPRRAGLRAGSKGRFRPRS